MTCYPKLHQKLSHTASNKITSVIYRQLFM